MDIQSQSGIPEKDIVKIKPEKIIKKWGFEEVIINRPEFCSKILHYNFKGSLSSFHLHLEKRELFKCIAGGFIFRYKDSKGNTLETIMNPEDCIYIPNGCPHQLESLNDNSEILEISTLHKDEDVIRISPGDSQK